MISPTRNRHRLADRGVKRSPASSEKPGFWMHFRRLSRNVPAARSWRARRALSLLEMMLVLAVLVAVAALVLPSLQGPLDDQRLLKSADLIRAQWTKARVTAMKNGRLYVFRYVTASNEYSVEPWSGEIDSVEASLTEGTENTAALPRVTDERPHPLGIAGQRLPDGIQFFAGEAQMDARLASVTADGSATASPEGSPAADRLLPGRLHVGRTPGADQRAAVRRGHLARAHRDGPCQRTAEQRGTDRVGRARTVSGFESQSVGCALRARSWARLTATHRGARGARLAPATRSPMGRG